MLATTEKPTRFEPLFDVPCLRLLQAMDPDNAVKACAEMLEAQPTERVAEVLELIRAAGVDPWAVALERRYRAFILRLAPLGVDYAVVLKIQDASSPHREIRLRAAEHLGCLPPSPQGLAALAGLTEDDGWGVRSAAAKSLRSFAPAPGALRALVNLALASPVVIEDAYVCIEAIKSIEAFAPAAEALDALVVLAKGRIDQVEPGDFVARRAAIGALASFAPAPKALLVLTVLAGLAGDKDWGVRAAAAKALLQANAAKAGV